MTIREKAPLTERLPDEYLVPSTRGQVLTIAAAALLLAALVNAGFAAFLAKSPRNRGYVTVETKWRLMAAETAPHDLVFLGDSSCNQGVEPTVIERVTQKSALNACAVGSATVANDAWMMRWYVERVGKPRAFVIVHTYDVWRRDQSTVVKMLWTIPQGVDGWGRAPRPELELTEQLMARVGRWFPLYVQSTTIANLIKSPGSIFHSPDMTFRSDGFMPVEHTVASNLDDDLPKHYELLRSGPFEVSPWTEAAMTQIIHLADANQVDVYLAMAPIERSVGESPEYLAWLGPLQANFARWDAASDRVHVLLDRPMPVAPEMLEKVDHVYTEGAVLYSEHLGQALVARAVDAPDSAH